MISLGNPVAGLIRPPGSPVILGSFRVTATFGAIDAFHPANNPDGTHGHQGVDIGNGKLGDPILAMADGKVAFSDLIGAAKVVRIDHTGGYQSGYAHLATIETKKGLLVKRGQRIGTLGSTGATAAHLHLGLKRNGVEIDSWPLLDQNSGGDVTITNTVYPAPRTWQTKAGPLTGYAYSGATKSGNFEAGSPALSDAEVTLDPPRAGWPAGPYQRVTNGMFAGYLLANSQITLSPIPASGDCTAAVKAATDPLTKAVNDANAKLASIHNLSA